MSSVLGKRRRNLDLDYSYSEWFDTYLSRVRSQKNPESFMKIKVRIFMNERLNMRFMEMNLLNPDDEPVLLLEYVKIDYKDD